MNARALLVVVALALTGCMTPAPHVVVDGPYGDVFAEESLLAADVADDLARLVPQIRALLPGTRADAAPDVWVQRELSLFRGWPVHESVGGFAVTSDTWLHWWTGDRIHVEASDPARRRLFLAHELVHAVVDEAWHTLPPAVEEGLCDEVAIRLEPTHGAAHRGVLLLATGLGVGHLPLSIEYRRPGRAARRVSLEPDVPAESPRDALEAGPSAVKGTSGIDAMKRRGIGFVVVGRIVARTGFGGLHALAADAQARGHSRVSADALLAASQLDDLDDWRAAIDARVGRTELEAIAREIGEELGRRTAPIARSDLPGWDVTRFTSEAEPVLVYGRGRRAIAVPLGRVESYRDGLLEAWDEAVPDSPRYRRWRPQLFPPMCGKPL